MVTSLGPTANIEELQKYFEQAGRDLERKTVLVYVAAVEALLRRDLLYRVKHSKRIDPIRRAFHQKTPVLQRIRFDDIASVWKDLVHQNGGPAGALSDLRPLIKHRHWLAHGMHWTDKSGIVATVANAAVRFNSAQDAIRKHVDSSFPLH